MSAPAGWHRQPDGRDRYWDGQQWTEHYHVPGQDTPAPVVPAQAKKKGPLFWVAVVIGGLAALLFVIGALGSLLGGDGEDAEPTSAASATASATAPAASSPAETPSSTPPPTTAPADPLKAASAAATEAGVDGLTLTQDGDAVTANFAISDNFTNNLIRVGIASDTWAIAKAVRDAGIDYATLTVTGTFPMQDKFGNEVDDAGVYEAILAKETVDQVNFDNITALTWDNLPALTTTELVFLHPALRE